MTVNAFIFSWDNTGIESIVPITKYEDWEKVQLMEVIRGNERRANPLDQMISTMKMRALYNSQRHYEIYAIDCDESLDETFWTDMWEQDPQWCADIVRQKGYKIHSDRLNSTKVKIS
jgi:hypothetical protein